MLHKGQMSASKLSGASPPLVIVPLPPALEVLGAPPEVVPPWELALPWEPVLPPELVAPAALVLVALPLLALPATPPDPEAAVAEPFWEPPCAEPVLVDPSWAVVFDEPP
jgi:hypothetical protein